MRLVERHADSLLPGAELYPEILPARSGMLELDGLHAMYWEESGNPEGIPAVFLHGGPGAGSLPRHRQFFDPDDYRIVVYDQRGSGRSTPYAEIRDNSIQHLVGDLEVLREFLGIDSWLLFGGSWGSTLALVYAERFPERCRGLILRGIFLCTQREIEWFMHGMGRFFPEHWQRFRGVLGEIAAEDILKEYHARLTHPDPTVHLPAARAWCEYEDACSTLIPQAIRSEVVGLDRSLLAMARIEAHYFVNRGFMTDGLILQQAGRLSGIPGMIVQGRYDVICPMETAFSLHKAWPGAILQVVEDAGHSAWEAGIRSGLVAAVRQFAKSGSFS
jgi:proline iminopeptidase